MSTPHRSSSPAKGPDLSCDIDGIRAELDELNEARMFNGWTPTLEARYRELCRRERELVGRAELVRPFFDFRVGLV